MAPDRPNFGKPIDLTSKKGVIKVDGEVLTNPVKRLQITPEQLGKLRPLGIHAFLEVNRGNETVDYSKYVAALNTLKQKYPGEQPAEIWRRTIAGVIANNKGATAARIAETVFETDVETFKEVWMGASPHAKSGDIIDKLTSAIIENWPHK